MSVLRAIGLMSGTSLDGIDLAFVETDGEAQVRTGPFATRPYSDAERRLLRAALADARSLTRADERPGILPQAEAFLTRAHAEAVRSFCKEQGLDLASIDLVGFHGQTVLHRPKAGLTVQIGDGQALAEELGRPVVFDFRSADVAAGGQGAPLVPVFHRALATNGDLPERVAFLNIGGVANATLLDGAADPVACDTGPGNALIDDFVLARTGEPFDADGALAATGTPDETLLARWLAHPFFSAPPPKSLDRNAFDVRGVEKLSDADGAATLTAFTARAVASLLPHLEAPPKLWIACGGGARNKTLLSTLRNALKADVRAADEFGWNAGAIEAQAFAYLAVRSARGLPLTFPTTTGAPRPLSGGRLVKP
jgi:anhydro-N-acetylmuramic acid kinase